MSTKDQSKTFHESFSKFFEAPTRESLRNLLKEHVGEAKNLDFKETWPEHSSIAKHLIGLANVGGGCLIIGVKESAEKNLTPIGLPTLKDKADVINGVKLFLPEPLLAAIEIADYSYVASDYPTLIGKKFQVLFLHSRPNALPFTAQKSGTGVRAGAIYIRREGITEEASYEEVQRLIKYRLDSSPQTVEARDLKEHLEELKVLYSEIPETIKTTSALYGDFLGQLHIERVLGYTFKKNPEFPNEDYFTYIRRLIDKKKKLIDSLVGSSAK